MFDTLKQRLHDSMTIGTLCSTAERHARRAGQPEPGAEHVVLAALDLPDGTARRAFERLQLDPAGFGTAIEQQYTSALQGVVDLAGSLPDAPSLPAAGGPHRSQASARALMDVLANQVMPQARRSAGDPALALCGAHVLLAASAAQFGVVARAMQALGSDSARLGAAAAAVLAMD